MEGAEVGSGAGVKCARPDCKEAARFTPVVTCWREPGLGGEPELEPVTIALRVPICSLHRLDWLDNDPGRLVEGFWDLVAKKGAAEGWKTGPDRTRSLPSFLPVAAGVGLFAREEN